MNYLRPNIKRGNYSKEEEDTIIRVHESLGNRYSNDCQSFLYTTFQLGREMRTCRDKSRAKYILASLVNEDPSNANMIFMLNKSFPHGMHSNTIGSYVSFKTSKT